jgi:hypothetical protein
MGKRRDPRSVQNHAEGQHGDKTHRAFIESLEGSGDKDLAREHNAGAADEFGRPLVGKHRLHEDREQHDEAERNSEFSEKDRLDRE